MALINNWDLKEINNSIYQEKGERPRYVVTDLGATFGETGNSLTRSKSNPGDYSRSKFIQKVTSDHVDFYLSSRPFFLTAIDVPNYTKRTHMQEVAKDIPIADARWLGKLLEPLSDEQIRDCFRAAGYSPQGRGRKCHSGQATNQGFEPAGCAPVGFEPAPLGGRRCGGLRVSTSRAPALPGCPVVVHEFGIQAAGGEQFRVGTALDDLRILHHEYDIRPLYGSQVVSDHDTGLAFHQAAQRLEDRLFGSGIQT